MMTSDQLLRRSDGAPLSERERSLMLVCIDRYEADVRTACSEDQGNPDGAPGTLGHTIQAELRDLRETVRGL